MATMRKQHRMCFEEQVIQFGLHFSADLVKETGRFFYHGLLGVWWGILVSVELLTILWEVISAYLYHELKPWIDNQFKVRQRVVLSEERKKQIKEFSHREGEKKKEVEQKRMEMFLLWRRDGVITRVEMI